MCIQPAEKTTAKTATAAFYPQEIKKKAIYPSTLNGGPAPASKQVAPIQ